MSRKAAFICEAVLLFSLILGFLFLGLTEKPREIIVPPINELTQSEGFIKVQHIGKDMYPYRISLNEGKGYRCCFSNFEASPRRMKKLEGELIRLHWHEFKELDKSVIFQVETVALSGEAIKRITRYEWSKERFIEWTQKEHKGLYFFIAVMLLSWFLYRACFYWFQ